MSIARLFRIAAGASLALALLAPQIALAANVFYGEVQHVSTTNIKVRNPHNGQILSFELIPHFNKVFLYNGKTMQMNSLLPGQYVGVIYDQKVLGARHADSIYIMNNANQRLQKVPGG
jgi:hypothetical protein